MINLDFGTDWGNSAAYNFKNGHYVLGFIQEVNGMAEVAIDFGLAYVGASLFGSMEVGITTATTSGSLSVGYSAGKSQFTNSIYNLQKKSTNTLNNIFSTISNGIKSTFKTTKAININQLVKNPIDPFDYDKGNYSYEALRSYRDYIKENGTIPEPIRVNKLENGKYMISDGHHRWYAAKQMGLKEVPIIIEE